MIRAHLCMVGIVVLAATDCSGLAVTPADASIKPMNGDGTLKNGELLGEFLAVGSPGGYRVTARVAGIGAGSGNRYVALSVDRTPWRIVAVQSDDVAEYAFDCALTGPSHVVGVQALGDGKEEGPLLRVESVTVAPAAEGPEPGKSSVTAWNGDAEAREAAVLAQSADAIRVLRMSPAVVTVLDPKGKPAQDAKVWIEQTNHVFLFGCNICGWEQFGDRRLDDAYKERFAELFNYATHPFYWMLYEPERGEPNYAYTDAVLSWCAARGIQAKGHPLLWANKAGVPPWSDGQPPQDVQRRRVEDLMRRFAGRIGYWEVVNEPVNAPGLDIAGPHEWARAADPAAKLVINEYGIFYEGHPDFYRFLAHAVEQGIPFDVVGIQAHAPLHMAFPLDRVRALLDLYGGLGKQIHITEFTPTSSGRKVLGAPWRDAWDEAQQAGYAEQFYRVCFAHPAVTAISWWDFCDVGAWAPGGGLLREDCTPKPAFERLRKLIREEWWTRIETNTDAKGEVAFNGFQGAYRIRARYAGNVGEAEFQVERQGENRFVLHVTGNP